MTNLAAKEYPISVGLVGCGGIAQVFHLPLLKKHPDINVQALCDLDASKAAIVANKFNVSGVYQDIIEMLQKENLDAVFVLTPTNMHLPMSLMALDYGVHLFVEKPVALKYEDVERIKTKADEVNRTVMVGMQNRFRTDIQAMKKFFEEEELGKLFYLKSGWLQAKHFAVKQPWIFQKSVAGGGVLMDLGVQLIDLVWWILGKPNPKSVKATSYHIKEDLEVEDFCLAYITFDNGVNFSMEVSWDYPISKDYFFLESVGQHGIATLNPLLIQKQWHGHQVNITPDIKDAKISHFKKGYEYEINHFISFLTGKESTLESSIDDAVQVQKIINTMYESIAQGSEIKII